MANLFVLLLLISLGFLVAGLIKPSMPNKIFRQHFKRKGIALLFGSLALVFFILIGVFAEPAKKQTAVTPLVVNNVQQEAPAITDPIATTTETAQPDQTPLAAPTSPQPSANTNSTQSEPQEILYAIVSVTDGDTFKVSINGTTETVRAIGIDTPETVDPRKPVECFGKEASNRAKALLTGKKVRLEADSTQGDRDKYSRLLRYAWLEDGTFFNKQMIVDGYASEYTYNAPYKYQSEFKQAEADARNAKRGLWADNACVASSNSNQTPPPATIPSGHTFYTSSHYNAKFYYCDTDDGWKSLSPTYLKSFPSAEALLESYPSRTLHEACT